MITTLPTTIRVALRLAASHKPFVRKRQVKMKSTLKNIVKGIPFARSTYTKVRNLRDSAKTKAVFANHKTYFDALTHKGEGTAVLETHDGLRIEIRRNIWDARVVKEMFIDKPYVKHILLPPEPTIIDVGGYIGDFSLFAAHHLGARVIVYEPTTENYAMLRKNIELNNLGDRITAVNKGVSDSSEVTLNVQVKASEEVHVSAYWYENAEHRVIPCDTISEILQTHQLETIDLLKVDCEGGEYDIFPSVSDETYQQIQNIVFEYHPVEGYEEKLQRVLDRLKSAGYTLQVEGGIAYAQRI